MLMLMPMVPATTSFGEENGPTVSLATPMLASDASVRAQLQPAGAARWNAFSRLRQRWLQFQQRQVSRCRVFVVPCVAMPSAGGGGEAAFVLARPAFDLRWLRPLQRLADAHPQLYSGFGFCFFGVPSVACSIFLTTQNQARGISTSALNFFLCIMAFGFLSSKRYGLDRVAVRHIVLSFRFAIFGTLLATDFALNIIEVYTINVYIPNLVASAMTKMLFSLSMLLDCSPHLPPSVQIASSVRAAKCANVEY
jgi:hypothetical protein